nr:C4-dicarboxylate ABC transporter permease [Sedimentibacter sp.]
MLKKIPSSYALLFYIIIVLGIASYFVPAGTYDRVIDNKTGISYVVSDSYKEIERTPVSFFDLFKSIPQGMMESGNIIIFVLIAGGCFGVIQATGATDALIGSLVRKYYGNEKMIILLVMTVFSLSGAMLGTAEEALPLYPLIISLSLAMGYDKITGVAMVLLSTGSGFVAGFLNPFTTGIAQNISELPMFSGIGLRIIAHIIFTATSIIYVLRYVKKFDNENNKNDVFIKKIPALNVQQKRVIIVLIISFALLIVGIVKYKFYILEIATSFFIMAIISGLIGGLKPGRISSEFVKGASNLTYGALIIGLAKGVNVVMNYGNIMDSVIYTLSKAIEGFSPISGIIGMFVVQTIINIFISSGSGQAAATMPIMKTLADMSGITRQSAVLAFQFGDGFTNMISPTSGYFIAALALGDVEWKDWVKWVLPLFITWCLEGILILVISGIINYGPF